ncbi:MAG: DUF58 domain-containing protein [Haloarculaceae archaeon]
MRLTKRGWAAATLVALAIALAGAFGERSLNAVAAPTLTALVVAAIAVWRADRPTVEYDAPRPGFPGEERTLEFTIEGEGLATVRQPLPEGLTARPVDATVSLPHDFEQALTLEARGVYEIGPPEIRQRDPLGLVERRVDVTAGVDLLVYPQVYALVDSTLGGLLSDLSTAERQEFDRLREYTPGDPLRNVHWKSSAKRDDFLVMEFAPTERTETVHVAAGADEDRADRMAAAAATVVFAALDAGLKIELTTPDGHLPPGSGDTHRENALRLLARSEGGPVAQSDRAEADVVVTARTDSTVVNLPGGRRSLGSLVTGHVEHTDAEVVA